MVLLGSCNGIFRALDRRTGELRWATKVGPDGVQYFFHGDPLVTADAVVIGADTAAVGGIHAFDRATGQQRWKVAVDFGVNGPLAGLGRRAYAYTPKQGEIVSLDVDSGEVRWRQPLKVPGFEGPGAAANRVFAGAADGSLHALNADTGREEWRISLAAPITTSVSADETAVYVGTGAGTVYRVDPRSGAILGSQRVDEKLSPRSVPVRTNDSLLVLLTDEGADYRALVSLDLELEKVRWRQAAAKTWSTSRAFVWNDMVVLGTSSGELLAYCTTDGRPAWSHAVRGSVRSIGGSEDALYVSTREGTLYALAPVRACDAK